jgi:hypothetical protein
LLTLACFALAACGGGDDDGMTPNADARLPGIDAQLFDAPLPPANEYSIQLDGPSFLVVAADDALTNFTDLTVEMWVNPTADGRFAVQRADFGQGSAVLYIFSHNATGTHLLIGGCELQDDNKLTGWNHVAFTWERDTELNLYVNGEVAVTSTCAPSVATIQSGDTLHFGATGFAGRFDEIRLWNIALTEEEIAAGLNLEGAGDTDGVISRWAFIEGEGTTAANDSVETVLPATLSGAGAVWSANTPF